MALPIQLESIYAHFRRIANRLGSKKVSIKMRHDRGYGLYDLYRGDIANVSTGIYLNDYRYMEYNLFPSTMQHLIVSVKTMNDRERTLRFEITKSSDKRPQIVPEIVIDEYNKLLAHKKGSPWHPSPAMLEVWTPVAGKLRTDWTLYASHIDTFLEMRERFFDLNVIANRHPQDTQLQLLSVLLGRYQVAEQILISEDVVASVG